MRIFDLGRLYTDWDGILRGRECFLSDSVDDIIECVEAGAELPPFGTVDSDEARVVMAVPHDNSDENYPFYAEEDMNGCNQSYAYCYLLPEAGDE